MKNLKIILYLLLASVMMFITLTGCKSEAADKIESDLNDTLPGDIEFYYNESDEFNYNRTKDEKENNSMFRPRIIEFPASKAVASGWVDFDKVFDFMYAWVSVDKNNINTSFNALCSDGGGKFLWFKTVGDDITDAKGFEFIEFTGGLFISAIAIDDDFVDREKVTDNLKKWVDEHDNFELDFNSGRHQMVDMISEGELENYLGFNQLEIYLPIKTVK